MRLFLVVIIVLTLTSCLGIQNVKYAYTSTVLNDTNSGVVLGSEASGAGISFLNLETKEEIEYLGAKVFCMRLPVGEYSLYSVGGRSSNFGSEKPFTFTVNAGARDYIGTIVKGWLHPKRYKIDKKTVVSVKGYQSERRLFGGNGQALSLYGDPYDFVIVNNIGDVSSSYNKDCPGLDIKDISLSPMK